MSSNVMSVMYLFVANFLPSLKFFIVVYSRLLTFYGNIYLMLSVYETHSSSLLTFLADLSNILTFYP